MKNADTFHTVDTERVDARSHSLDTLSPQDFVKLMNAFDREAADAVSAAMPSIARAIEGIAERLRAGGRLLYIGAGTSGRLGVLDASECPPTFGVDPQLVQGIIAGGDEALRYAIEGAEDDPEAAGEDLAACGLAASDALVAISASGYAPYCVGGLRYGKSVGALTVSVSCNHGAKMSGEADIAIEASTGPEILSGSTRLKAGTATKMVLNMLSTGVMVQLGKVYQNLMVDVRATNAKLKDRVIRIVMTATGLDRKRARALLLRCDDEPKTAIVVYETGRDVKASRAALLEAGGRVGVAIELLCGLHL